MARRGDSFRAAFQPFYGLVVKFVVIRVYVELGVEMAAGESVVGRVAGRFATGTTVGFSIAGLFGGAGGVSAVMEFSRLLTPVAFEVVTVSEFCSGLMAI